MNVAVCNPWVNYRSSAFADGDAAAGGIDDVGEPSRGEVDCGSLSTKTWTALVQNGEASDGSTEIVESETRTAIVSSEEEMEPESYFGISLKDSAVQTEFADSLETDLISSQTGEAFSDVPSPVLGFEFVHLQAINNIDACKSRVFDLISKIPGMEGLGSREDHVLDLAVDEGVDDDWVGTMDMTHIQRARRLTENVHWVKCDTSYISICAGVESSHDDDWSSSNNIVAFAYIHDETHVFFLECAKDASVEMVCMYMHNYIVEHISKFLFTIEVPNTQENDLISEIDTESLELRIIMLVSHNGCLHPLGEPCLCSETDSDIAEIT